VKQMPEGFDAFKNNIDPVIGVPPARYTATLDHAQLRKIARAYANVREAAGDEIEIAVHCHNEFDTPSAIAVAKAVEPMDPLFLEDALNVPYSEGWIALKRATRVPILTGEKLELVRGFRPFLDNQAVDRAPRSGFRRRNHGNKEDRGLRGFEPQSRGAAQRWEPGAHLCQRALWIIDPEFLPF
jgi:L-alanine-DL-glutamate epimerase-like enolase superfamily enzyme